MKKRCLPCYLIARNIGILLTAIASTVLMAANIHASANSQTPANLALRQLFVYQLLANNPSD